MARCKNNAVQILAFFLIVLLIQLSFCTANFRGGNRFGHRALTGHHENPTECKLPSFEDSSEVKFSLEECQRLGNENYPVCTGRGTVPNDWVGFMICKNELLTVRLSSKCTRRGVWSPAFPSGCYQLLHESYGAIKKTSPTTALPSTQKTTKWPTTVTPQLTTTSVEDKETSAAQCPALRRKKPGLKVECTFRYKYVSVSNCEDPVPPGSEAKYSCEEHYETTSGLPSHFRKCKPDGTWTGTSDQFSCIVQCGTSTTPRVPYITFGTPSLRGQWPWHAALFIKTEIRDDKWSYACGGTLIGKRAVLTAAHCVTHLESTTLRSRTSMRVDLGKYYREEIDEFVQVRDIDDIVVHPSYSPYGYDSDLAVIILKEAVKVGFHIRPACFPHTTDSRVEELHLSENSIGTVVGWGYTEEKKLADVLTVTNLPVVSSRECLEEMQTASAFQVLTRSTTFCAGFKNNTNVCGGDSGGGMFFPFKHSDSTRWHLEGVVSVGIPDKEGNCDPTKYSTFTRVGRYADWIVRQLTEYDAV